jgi:hypothetical protein
MPVAPDRVLAVGTRDPLGVAGVPCVLSRLDLLPGGFLGKRAAAAAEGPWGSRSCPESGTTVPEVQRASTRPSRQYSRAAAQTTRNSPAMANPATLMSKLAMASQKALGHQLARGVVDAGDVIGVEGVPEPQEPRRDGHAQPDAQSPAAAQPVVVEVVRHHPPDEDPPARRVDGRDEPEHPRYPGPLPGRYLPHPPHRAPLKQRMGHRILGTG